MVANTTAQGVEGGRRGDCSQLREAEGKEGESRVAVIGVRGGGMWRVEHGLEEWVASAEEERRRVVVVVRRRRVRRGVWIGMGTIMRVE